MIIDPKADVSPSNQHGNISKEDMALVNLRILSSVSRNEHTHECHSHQHRIGNRTNNLVRLIEMRLASHDSQRRANSREHQNGKHEGTVPWEPAAAADEACALVPGDVEADGGEEAPGDEHEGTVDLHPFGKSTTSHPGHHFYRESEWIGRVKGYLVYVTSGEF